MRAWVFTLLAERAEGPVVVTVHGSVSELAEYATEEYGYDLAQYNYVDDGESLDTLLRDLESGYGGVTLTWDEMVVDNPRVEDTTTAVRKGA